MPTQVRSLSFTVRHRPRLLADCCAFLEAFTRRIKGKRRYTVYVQLKGRPQLRAAYSLVRGIETPDARTVVYDLTGANDRELPLILGVIVPPRSESVALGVVHAARSTVLRLLSEFPASL